jgi:hypothetical protein
VWAVSGLTAAKITSGEVWSLASGIVCCRGFALGCFLLLSAHVQQLARHPANLEQLSKQRSPSQLPCPLAKQTMAKPIDQIERVALFAHIGKLPDKRLVQRLLVRFRRSSCVFFENPFVFSPHFWLCYTSRALQVMRLIR